MKSATDNNTSGEKQRDLKRKIGAACFRFRAISVVPVILFIYFFFNPVDSGSFNPVVNVLGFLLAMTGAATRIVSVGYAKPFTSGRENYLKADSLNTRGIYSIVRNPLYIGNFFIYNGVLVAYSSPVALAFFNVFFITNYYFIILAEENYLEHQFGEDYREYRRMVPKVIPKFTHYRKNDRPFSLARVIAKEKNTTFYWIFFYVLSLLVKQYKLHDGTIVKFWWHAVPVLALFALNLYLNTNNRSRRARSHPQHGQETDNGQEQVQKPSQ